VKAGQGMQGLRCRGTLCQVFRRRIQALHQHRFGVVLQGSCGRAKAGGKGIPYLGSVLSPTPCTDVVIPSFWPGLHAGIFAFASVPLSTGCPESHRAG